MFKRIAKRILITMILGCGLSSTMTAYAHTATPQIKPQKTIISSELSVYKITHRKGTGKQLIEIVNTKALNSKYGLCTDGSIVKYHFDGIKKNDNVILYLRYNQDTNYIDDIYIWEKIEF